MKLRELTLLPLNDSLEKQIPTDTVLTVTDVIDPDSFNRKKLLVITSKAVVRPKYYPVSSTNKILPVTLLFQYCKLFNFIRSQGEESTIMYDEEKESLSITNLNVQIKYELDLE